MLTTIELFEAWKLNVLCLLDFEVWLFPDPSRQNPYGFFAGIAKLRLA